ncbi:uncharacterized protein LOC108954299 [Eucalyptus grandis]|uniref:uncharacterized protein LOC108954299 n=1 Tax=Eucalyptus grandis TaxID=71139 RepID=UPI00192E82C7|nr:uncharacterized protein LOC108954299 [Eucalyptus grandis]
MDSSNGALVVCDIHSLFPQQMVHLLSRGKEPGVHQVLRHLSRHHLEALVIEWKLPEQQDPVKLFRLLIKLFLSMQILLPGQFPPGHGSNNPMATVMEDIVHW